MFIGIPPPEAGVNSCSDTLTQSDHLNSSAVSVTDCVKEQIVKSELEGSLLQDGVHPAGQEVQDHLEHELLGRVECRDEVQAAQGDAQGGDPGQAALRGGRIGPTGHTLVRLLVFPYNSGIC